MTGSPNIKPQPRPRLHRHHILIFAFAFIVHGLLLLNDGIYDDGWMAHTFIEFGDRDRLYRWFFDSGVPHVYYLHVWLSLLPGSIFFYKLLAFLSIAFSGILIYSVAHESGLIGRLESLLIALLCLCYPAFQAAAEITILPFLICYTLFLLAVWLALRAQESAGRRHALLTVAALLCFFISFTIPSLLVFYAGFLWFLAATLMQRRGWNVRHVWHEFVPGRLHYLLLPVVFWGAKQMLLPARGIYAEYNQFQFTSYSLIYNFRTFLASSIFDQFNRVLSQISQPAQWLLLLLAAQGIYIAFGLARRKFTGTAIRPGIRLWFGFVLLLLGIIPYVLVSKAPNVTGFGTRHALLISLPMAIIIVTLVRLMFVGDNDETGLTLSNIGWVFLTVLILLFSATMMDSYLDWQARWVKSRAVMQALAQDKSSREYSTYWVYDNFNIGERDPWPFAQWASLFRTVWKEESRVGMDTSISDLLRMLSKQPEKLTPPANSHFNISNWNPGGHQADLTIEPGPAAASSGRIAGYYFYYKFLRPNRLSQFLNQVATVRVAPAAKRRELPLPRESSARS